MSHIEVVSRTNVVEVKPFSGLYTAPDMLSMTVQYIMPTLPTANCFALLAFFIERLLPEGAGVSYKEIVARTCIKSNKTACVTVDRLILTGTILADSRNKRDTENVYRLNPDYVITMPQNQVVDRATQASVEITQACVEKEDETSKTKPCVKTTYPVNTGDSEPCVKTTLLTTINTCNTCKCGAHELHVRNREHTHEAHTHEAHTRMWDEALWHLEHQVMPAVFRNLFMGLCVLEVWGDCLVLQANSDYQRAWLEKDHLDKILQTVQEFEDYRYITTIEVVARKRG